MGLLLILLGCDDPSGLDGARARARAFLDEHPDGTAFVRVGVDTPDFDAVVSPAWEGTDLAAFLRICGGPPTVEFDAELSVGPARFPHPYLDQRTEGEVSACVWDRLATFPVDGPTGRDEQSLFVVRWRPEEDGDGAAVHQRTAEGLPRGALALPPPYYRHGSGVAWSRVVLEDGGPRFRYEDGEVFAGPLADAAGWARDLGCTAAERDVVRVTLLFRNGEVDEVHTTPHTECVHERARSASEQLAARTVGGERVDDLGRVVVVLDVPVRPW